MAKDSKKIGVFIDVKEISVSLASISQGKIKTEKEFSFPTNFTPKEKMIKPISLNNEFFDEKMEWVVKFKDLFKKNSLGSADVVVSLSHNFSITRFFVMPYVDKKFWNKSVPIESKKYIPVAFEEMSYDFFASPVMNNTKIAVLFGITQRKTVEFLLELFKNLNCKITAIETSAISFERLLYFLDAKDHEKKVYVHFFKSLSYSLFSYAGCPVIFRESSSEGSSTMSERKTLDLKGSMAFVKRYVPEQDYAGVVLSGDAAALWQKIAETESGLKTEILDFKKLSDINKNDFSSLCSIASSMIDAVKNTKNIDISGITAGKRLAKRIQVSILTIVGTISAFFLILGGLNYVRIMSLDSRLNSISSRMTEVSDFNGLSPDLIREKVETVKNQNEIIKSLFSDKDFLAPKLSAIADAIPPSLWVKELTYISAIGASEISGQGKTIEMKGETSLKGDSKFTAVDFFIKKLKSLPEFKAFVDPRGQIDKNFESSVERKSFSYGAVDTSFLNDTSGFTITCQEKKRR